MTGKRGWTSRFSSEEIASAVREGFEPSVAFLGYGALAKRCFRPLSHLTKLLYNNALQLFVVAENWEL